MMLILVWQTGELERLARRFRRPILRGPAQAMGNAAPLPVPIPAATTPVVNERPQEGPMAAVTAGLRLVEQILFVFVASLWPNAVGGGEMRNPPEVVRAVPPPAPPERARDDANDDTEDEEGPENNGVFQDAEAPERVDVVVQ
jgi:hypothetical protein